VKISSKLLCLFSADVSEAGEDYVIRVPRRELETGALETDQTYRVALIDADAEETAASVEATPTEDAEPAQPAPGEPQPPVEAGEIRYVEIEDIGKQGDGIARVERGYVIIVPDTETGEQVKVEIEEVKSNFAVAAVIEGVF